MQIGILGAGVAGLSAAFDLARAGHSVTVYEAAPQAGGLASGFRDERWDWALERFYHHIFTTDADIIKLVEEIGFADNMFFKGQITAQWWRGHAYPISGGIPGPDAVAAALAVLRVPFMPFVDRVRFGLASAYLKYAVRDWRPLERVTAAAWTRRWMGRAAHESLVQPLLDGKFGPYADQVNMSWLWARFKARSFKLGYFKGGFQALCDALLDAVRRQGASVHLGTPVQSVERLDENGRVRWRVHASAAQGAGVEEFDRLIMTGAPGLLSRLVPELPESYLGQLRKLDSMGAVVMTLALREQLLTDGTYWLMPPKTEFPFLALVEHTNFIDPKHYGGDRLVYCGDYLEPSHDYFRLSPEELLERFVPALQRINPRFERSWIRAYWLHREPYAQPIVKLGHSANIPPLQTPLPGLYWASMSQVYPWDRGTNFAVEIGRRVAR
ncbi:MAG TPA: NAD(P)/FAD-dependent oxidoreductase, partial [Roseiflexaceae bacterium]|nr:NAD(P)/FAD-dependent oxidoreductase [Roseiflexaceae bacterium]